MPRRNRPERRRIDPDPRYNNATVQQTINRVMQRGKKGTAERIVYEALHRVGESTRQDALEVFLQALRNVTPQMEVKPRRVGGGHVPSSGRDPGRPAQRPRHPLAAHRRARAQGYGDGAAARSRDRGRLSQYRRRGEAPGGHTPDGGGQSCVRALPLVAVMGPRDLSGGNRVGEVDGSRANEQ